MRKQRWWKVVLNFSICTVVAMTALAIHLEKTGALVHNSPNTAFGAFMVLMALAIPSNIIQIALMYLVYYFLMNYVSLRLNRAVFIAFILLFGFLYFYFVQAILGGVIGNVDEYSFVKSFKRISYFHFYLTIVYMLQIDISLLRKKRVATVSGNSDQ
jgi:hypothetical protein